MRRSRKSAAVQRFNQAWDLFCNLLPNVAPPILVDLHGRALLAAGVVRGQDMTDEQAIHAEKVIDRLNGEIADYRRARYELIDAFARSVERGSMGCINARQVNSVRLDASDANDWRKSANSLAEVLRGA